MVGLRELWIEDMDNCINKGPADPLDCSQLPVTLLAILVLLFKGHRAPGSAFLFLLLRILSWAPRNQALEAREPLIGVNE